MKKHVLTTLLLTIVFNVLSFEVPKDYKLENKEDYLPLETDVVNAINWLSETPTDEQEGKRMDVNRFVLQWIVGSPYVHIEIKQEIFTFSDAAPDLLIIFLGGWAKYSIETKDYDNKIEGSLAGINAVIDFYTKNKKSLPKSKEIEDYIKMKEDGTLKEYVEKNA